MGVTPRGEVSGSERLEQASEQCRAAGKLGNHNVLVMRMGTVADGAESVEGEVAVDHIRPKPDDRE